MNGPSDNHNDSISERRRYPRIPLIRPVKIRCIDTGRYIPAQTADLSPGGVLVTLNQQTALKPGQNLKLGIALSDQQPILNSQALIHATVKRTADLSHGQHIALQFAVDQDWLSPNS